MMDLTNCIGIFLIAIAVAYLNLLLISFKATLDFKQAIKLQPEIAYDFFFNRGFFFRNLGKYRAALSEYNEAIKLQLDYSDAYNARGDVYLYLGDKQAALADFDRAIQLKSDYADAYYNRGLVNTDLGNKQAALFDFEKARDLYQSQENTKLYNESLNRIKELH